MIWLLECDRQKLHPVTFFHLPFPNVLYRLFLRWTHNSNPWIKARFQLALIYLFIIYLFIRSFIFELEYYH